MSGELLLRLRDGGRVLSWATTPAVWRECERRVPQWRCRAVSCEAAKSVAWSKRLIVDREENEDGTVMLVGRTRKNSRNSVHARRTRAT